MLYLHFPLKLSSLCFVLHDFYYSLYIIDGCFFITGPAATSVWDFGGTWSSELAGVRFEMDSRSTVGVDKNIPVRILQDGTRLNGFLNKGWMAKANAQYGRYGPVTLFAINRPERNVAAFVGINLHTFIAGAFRGRFSPAGGEKIVNWHDFLPGVLRRLIF